jgi:hypothetical protein
MQASSFAVIVIDLHILIRNDSGQAGMTVLGDHPSVVITYD